MDTLMEVLVFILAVSLGIAALAVDLEANKLRRR